MTRSKAQATKLCKRFTKSTGRDTVLLRSYNFELECYEYDWYYATDWLIEGCDPCWCGWAEIDSFSVEG